MKLPRHRSLLCVTPTLCCSPSTVRILAIDRKRQPRRQEYGEVPPGVMLPHILKYSRYKIVAAERTALEFGCMLSIHPDAHSISELDHMRWRVAITPKGRCSRRPVLAR